MSKSMSEYGWKCGLSQRRCCCVMCVKVQGRSRFGSVFPHEFPLPLSSLNNPKNIIDLGIFFAKFPLPFVGILHENTFAESEPGHPQMASDRCQWSGVGPVGRAGG